jgi:membrane protein required for beta-lactamase induction
MKAGFPDLRGASAERLNRLVWFGVLGGPVAWAAQFLFAMQFGLARCESPNDRFPFPVLTISAVLGAVAVLVGVLAELVAIAVFRATREDGHTQTTADITSGRLRFLATVGMTVNPLALTISAMVAIGVPLLGVCHQS